MDQTAVNEVQSALRRVASRLRLAQLVQNGVPALVIVLVLLAVVVALQRMNVLGARAALALGAGIMLIVASSLVTRVRRVPPAVAAHEADVALGLADRLGSAYAFTRAPVPTALMLAAIADAARAAIDVDARRVVALPVPRSAWGVPLGVVMLCAACFVHPRPPARRPELRLERSRFVVEPDALAAERRAVQRLGVESRGKDEALAQLARKLEELLAAVDKQQLSRAEVFEQLARLDAEHPQAPTKVTRPSESLEAGIAALAKTKQTQRLAEALKSDDLAAAKTALEKLAAEAEQNAAAPSAEEKAARDEMARALDRASKALDDASKKAQAARDQELDELKEEERRLQKKHDEHPDDEETERRLQKNKRTLERLEREKQAEQEQRRQLQRLQKDLQQAAEQLRQKMSPEAMRRAAEELGKMEDEIRKLGSDAQARMQIAQIKEVLRRAGRVEKGDGGEGQQGKSKDGRGQKLSSFDRRAGGKNDTLLLGGDGQGDTHLLLPLPGQGEPQPGQGDQPGPGHERPGDGIGDQHDPDLLGDPTKLAAAKKTIHAKGQSGNGPSRSQTILGASDKGFSSRDYHKVYDDYSAVVEDVMSQEGVPPGYRYYVKRYFQLIRPRE